MFHSLIGITLLGRTLAPLPTVSIVLLFMVVAQSAGAQSTIFNVPTTDTVAKGKGYFEFDFQPQAPGPETGASTIIYDPRLVVGLPYDVEVGVNAPVYHNGDASPSNLGYVQPNLKWRFYKNDDRGVAAAAGVVSNAPINNRDSQLAWAYAYGNISKKVKSGNYGPRLTVGPYVRNRQTRRPGESRLHRYPRRRASWI